jgi:hypothetical protein
MALYWQTFKRAEIEERPEALYVFPDNAARTGCNPIFEDLRDHPSAVGVAVRRSPEAPFETKTIEENCRILEADFAPILAALAEGRDVVMRPEMAVSAQTNFEDSGQTWLVFERLMDEVRDKALAGSAPKP